jgi:P27 family predicted phage terminase small subunit
MTRGRKPTPTALKLERGNPGHRPLNAAEPVLARASAALPAGLKGRARKEWTRLAEELITKGVLTVADMHAFEEYCTLVGEVDDYEKLIRRVGRETAHRLGYANYLLKLRTQLRQQAAHLGLTPSSRSGVKAVKVVAAKNAAQTKRERFFGAAGAKPA